MSPPTESELSALVDEIRRLHAAGDYEAAFARNEALLARCPGNGAAWLRRGRLAQLVDEAVGGGLASARGALAQAITLEPEAAGPLIEAGHFAYAVDDRAEQGRALFEQARRVALEHLLEALRGEAACRAELGDAARAARCEAAAAEIERLASS